MDHKPTALPLSLHIKSLLVGTVVEAPLLQIRRLLHLKHHLAHPELSEVHLEERWLPAALSKILKPDSCCVDVGAHIGSFASLLQKHAPKGNHVAFEPSETKSVWLKRQFPQFEVYSFAVSDRAGDALFREDLTRPGYSRLQDTNDAVSGSVSYGVRTCRLDDILAAKKKIDLIKLDIEGGELSALRGAVATIKRTSPAIIFECGSAYDPHTQRSALYHFIADELHYSIFCFSDFLFDKGPMGIDEFRKCGMYPFRAFNFIATPQR